MNGATATVPGSFIES